MLHKYIENQEFGEKPMESILGDATNVARLGAFYFDNSDLLKIAELHCKLVFYETESFDEKEAVAYRKGMDDFVAFLRHCSEENQEVIRKP